MKLKRFLLIMTGLAILGSLHLGAGFWLGVNFTRDFYNISDDEAGQNIRNFVYEAYASASEKDRRAFLAHAISTDPNYTSECVKVVEVAELGFDAKKNAGFVTRCSNDEIYFVWIRNSFDPITTTLPCDYAEEGVCERLLREKK